MKFQPRQPLTPGELARRTEALLATRPNPAIEVVEEFLPDDVKTSFEVPLEPDDTRLYGARTAKLLRDAKRGVALASEDAKLAVFHEVVVSLSEVLIPEQAAHLFRDDVARPFRLIVARHSD